jgi:glucosamine 6-phosphate synthetase-like amidotransferase/phosphosugar isomerase protein
VSQSGDTADTLASLRYAREHKQRVLSVVIVPTSTIARESDIVMPTLTGPASTKAFTCQLAALALAIAAGRAGGVLTEGDEKRLSRALIGVPRLLTEALALDRISSNSPVLSRNSATCSISAAARASRSRPRARSSSRKSSTSMPRVMRPASSSTA